MFRLRITMRTLLHNPLQPQSRTIRLMLKEKRLEVVLQVERPWERREAFLAMNPAGETPVMIEESGPVICGTCPIAEYLEETFVDVPLLGVGAADRAEVRRLVDWFHLKFDREVTQNLLYEKIFKRFAAESGPDSAAIRAGKANIRTHLGYISWLADRRNWLAGEALSLADLAAAAQLSAIDYIGDVPWDEFPTAKDWYVRIKSRPSFRPLLADHIPGAPPPPHYADLDF
jgi:glutathione S-transferase